MCQVLIDHGANILKSDKFSRTPIDEVFKFTKQNKHEIQNQQLIRMFDNAIEPSEVNKYKEKFDYYKKPLTYLILPIKGIKDFNHYLELAFDAKIE